MIGSTAARIYIVAALILAAYGVAHLVQAALEPPEVVLPHWTFEEMPLQLGDWCGAKCEMNPAIAMATGADRIVNREYKDERGHAISIHTAMFKRPEPGMYHYPVGCYRAHGWQLIQESRANLHVSDGLTIPVSLTSWDREGEKLLVIYWYQLGEHVLFDRMDLGLKVRWSLRGRPKWPALLKVMLQISAPEPEDAKTAILGFAEQVAKWENQPAHQKDTLRFDTTSNGG